MAIVLLIGHAIYARANDIFVFLAIARPQDGRGRENTHTGCNWWLTPRPGGLKGFRRGGAPTS